MFARIKIQVTPAVGGNKDAIIVIKESSVKVINFMRLTNTQTRLLYLLATILWAGLIFYLSSIPDLRSGLPTLQDLILRKLAHVFVFFIFTYLLAHSLNSTQRPYLLFVIMAAVLYAFIDEFHQLNVVGRQGSSTDILVDSVGIFLAIVIYIQTRKGLFD